MNPHFRVFTMPDCPDCKNAKNLLSARGESFTERTEFTREELQAIVGPVRTLPQITARVGDDLYHVGGFKDLVQFVNTNYDLSTLRKIG